MHTATFVASCLLITVCSARQKVNIARGRMTSQSSAAFQLSMNTSLTSARIVDGDPDTNVYHGSCVLTAASDVNPWVAVDLGTPIIVTGVQLTNIANTCYGDTSDYASATLMYPFGIAVGDNTGPANTFTDSNNGYTITPTSANPPFKFFNKQYANIYICNNGFLTLDYPRADYYPFSVPVAGNMIAAYLADIYLYPITPDQKPGEIFYRLSRDSTLLERAAREIQRSFPGVHLFRPLWLFIVTWSNVTFYFAPAENANRVNTFQIVLATDGETSFVIFNYDKLMWTSATSCGGNSLGLGITAASAIINAGDGLRAYIVPSSMTPAVINLTQTSNVGINGRWMFRVDGSDVQLPSCSDSGSGVNSSFIVGLSNIDPTIQQPNINGITVCGVSSSGLIPDGSSVYVQCPTGVKPSEYVIIQKPNRGSLAFCEVEIYAQGYNWFGEHDARLVGTVSRSMLVDEPFECQRICYMDEQCDSINYHPTDAGCELIVQYNRSTVNSTDVVHDPGWEWWHPEYTLRV